MADEISLIPKDYRKRGIKIKTALFSSAGILVIILIIISILIYGGLTLYKFSLNKQITEIKKQAQGLDQKRDIKFEGSVISLEKTIDNLKTLFDNHIYWSNVFPKIESLAIPEVTFSEFNGRIEGNSVKIIISGATNNYSDLAKQMVSFSNDPMVSKVDVSGLRIIGKKIGFELTLSLSRKILSFTPVTLAE